MRSGHSQLRKARQGTSLVELLVSMTLLGVVLIPIFFMSSAYFLSQLGSIRSNMDASHSASTFLNRFLEELSLSQRILVQSSAGDGKSDSSNIYFAYFDPITQKEVKVGYKLVTSGSNKILQRVTYNTTTNTWSTESPYGAVPADQITLQSQVSFKYCLTSTVESGSNGNCASNGDSTSNPDKAVFVRLTDSDASATTGWIFTKGGRSFALRPDTDIFLATNSTEIPPLSQEVKEQNSFTSTSSFGASASLGLVNLSPDGSQLNYTSVTTSAGSGGILSTMVPSGVNNMGTYSITTDPITGRVFFGSNASPSPYLTWKDNILSTILSNQAFPGYGDHISVTAPNGRVYFAGDNMMTWYNNVLSTIGVNYIDPQYIIPTSSRVYYRTTNQMMTWDPVSNKVSTLNPSAISNLAGDPGMVVNNSERLFFGQASSPGSVWTWDPISQRLSTLATVGATPGNYSMTVDDTGRLYFGNSTTSSTMWCWDPSSNRLSTVLSGINRIGSYSTVGLGDSVYFGESIQSGPSNFRTWNATTNVLSTILPTSINVYSVGVNSTRVTRDSKIAFAYQASNANLYYYNPTTRVLSTVLPSAGGEDVGYSTLTSGADGRLFFGSWSNPGNFWTWGNNKLSTLLSGVSVDMGMYDSIAVSSTGRVIWGMEGTTGYMYTWYNNVLSTIHGSAIAYVGSHATAVGPDDRFYFGQDFTSSYMWTWKENTTTTGSILRFSNNGITQNQSLNLTLSGSPTYIASAQDINGEFYFVDSTAKTLDRYTYSGMAYTKFSSLNLGTWGNNVSAIAIDQASSGISILDGTGKKLYLYSDRKASGTPSPTSVDLTAISTPMTTPTGLAINGRTGDHLVLDSAVQGSGASSYVRLFRLSSTGTYQEFIKIWVNNTNYLSVDASAETNFKIQYNEQRNLVYLLSPSLSKTFVLTLPTFLD